MAQTQLTLTGQQGPADDLHDGTEDNPMNGTGMELAVEGAPVGAILTGWSYQADMSQFKQGQWVFYGNEPYSQSGIYLTYPAPLKPTVITVSVNVATQTGAGGQGTSSTVSNTFHVIPPQ